MNFDPDDWEVAPDQDLTVDADPGVVKCRAMMAESARFRGSWLRRVLADGVLLDDLQDALDELSRWRRAERRMLRRLVVRRRAP